MATPQKIIVPPQHIRSEMPLANRLSAADSHEGPSLHHFTVSVAELLVVLKNWMLSKFCVIESSQSVDVKGFNRPRSGGSHKVEGHMKESIGLAKYQRDPRNRR